MPKLRVGIGDVLDARPLAWGLLKGHHADLFSPVTEPLPLVGRLLAQGDLEVGLLPVIDAAGPPDPGEPAPGRPPGLLALPDLCVAFPREARSIVLVSPSPPAEIRRIYLGRSARTAAAVTRVVLAEGYGITPDYLAEDPPPAPVAPSGSERARSRERLEPGEASLRIGGSALRLAHRESGNRGPKERHVLDLGTAWRELTGLPLVVGLWGVRADVTLPELPFYFKSSLRYGLASLSAIAREAAAELGLDSAEIEGFLRKTVSYVLRDEERRGVDELLRRSARHGIVAQGFRVRFWPS